MKTGTKTCVTGNYCGQTGTDRACRGFHPRNVRCFHCGNPFHASCGAQLFCSDECRATNPLGREINDVIESGRIDAMNKAKRKAQLRAADRAWRKTPYGILARREQNRRHYRLRKEKKKSSLEEPGSKR